MSETLPETTVKIEASPADDSVPPPSDFDTLKARLKESPHDPETWKRFVDVAESSGDGSQIREAYDALLKQYPNTATAQIAYLKHVLNRRVSMTTDVEQLLNKFLRTSPSVELWRFYLDYVLRVNVTPSPTTRETVRKSYDYALSHIGYDRDSGSAIWAEYIQFLRNAPEGSTWDNQQKMDAVRKAQNQAVQLPLDNVEQLWAQLESYETSLNKTTAKKIMTDLSPAHMQARTVLRQLNIHLQGLGTSNTNGIFLPAPPTFSPQERQLIGRWKSYLKWEEGNPLELEEKDRATLVARVGHAYRKAVIRMRYYPEIWFMAYTWCTSVGQNAEALSFLRSGLEANPESFVLTYAYVELLEKAELKKDQRDFSTIHSVYERFIGGLRAHLARLTELAAQLDVTTKEATEEPKDESGSLESIPANSATAAPGLNSRYQAELVERKRHYANAWIAYMRFARRSQGQTTCRETFSKARKDEYVGWEVYEAAALTEYRCNSEDGRLVASRIFETGMKKFGTDASYVLAHLSFLLTVNDENNARALFERVIGTFTPAEAKPIWERWSRSQYQYDDLEAVLEIERRMAETYPNDAPIKRFAQRHTYHQIDAIAEIDLGFAKSKKATATNPGPFGPNPSYPPSDRLNSLPNDNPSVKTSVNGPAPNPPPPPNPNKRPPPPPERKPTDFKRPRPDERERRRSPPPPPRRDPPKEEKPIGLPAVLSWFVTQLPPRETFDGPVFNTDNLMDTLRTAVIPSSTNRVRSPPPPAAQPRSAGGGRPPPDYGPYQGPQSGPPRGRPGRY
ncbi:mRNA 3'-end-processing protein RNA14 [Favolaschia claudopus]|uniref:mRNA 3'-end-processing protein RNA14 n=1 Tax=Favolaschia claudopus TaxID=2862362 RepID=A0AAW0DT97_9AGAR